MEQTLTNANMVQLGAVAVIFIFAIKEFFAYLQSRKSGENGNSSVLNSAILSELRNMNSNHLHSIQEAVENGNSRLVDVIHADNSKIIELLGEIKGTLHARR